MKIPKRLLQSIKRLLRGTVSLIVLLCFSFTVFYFFNYCIAYCWGLQDLQLDIIIASFIQVGMSVIVGIILYKKDGFSCN